MKFVQLIQSIYRYIEPFKECVEAPVFIRYYRHTQDKEILEIMRRVKKTHKLQMLNYDFVDKYKDMNVEINYDKHSSMYYINHFGHRMYFNKSLNSKKKVLRYYKSLVCEQDKQSPHRYLTPDFDLEPCDVVIDGGVAEGNFILDNLDKAKRFIGVECDQEWMEALKKTFEKEINEKKVILIPKMLGDSQNENMTSIDEIYKEYPEISFVKMDIEGSELNACKGGLQWLSENKNNGRMVICTYHTPEAYDKLTEILQPLCEVQHTDGYIILNSILGKPNGYFKPPYVRRGVIRAIRKKC